MSQLLSFLAHAARQAPESSSFSYGPRLSPSEIRLLTILPARRRGRTVEITVSVHALESNGTAPVFDAISYCWGDASDTQLIRCNGASLGVTKTLYWALRRIRRKSEAVVVWADALCINQADVVERNAQVAIMGRIYAAARKVYICLGEAKEYGTFFGNRKTREEMEALVRVLDFFERRDVSSWPLSLKQAEFAGVWLHVFRIHQERWFRRSWTLQEAGLAVDPRVLYGRWEFGYRVFLGATRWLAGEGGTFRLKCGSMVHLRWADWREVAVSRDRDGFDGLGFFDILNDARSLNCKDPRDHVYALLGHPVVQLEELDASIRVPDYAKDASVLFRQLSEFLARKNEVRLLCCLGSTHESLAEVDVPSWVIRQAWWDTAKHNNQFALPGLRNLDRPCWEASKGLKGPQLILDGDLLQIQGAVIDDVLEVYDIHHDDDTIQFQRPLGDATAPFGPGDLISRIEQLPLVYGNDYPTQDSHAHPLVYEGLSTPAHYLTATLGGGFISSRSLSEYLQSNVLVNLTNKVEQPEQQARNADPQEEAARRHGMAHEQDETIGEQYLRDVRKACQDRRFAITRHGHYIIGPAVMEPRDVCCVLSGFPVPVILRASNGHRRDEDEAWQLYRFLGEAWSCGLVNGEAALMVEAGLISERSFFLC
ncbi:heterokaryon incompatibility protein-domain-containing protein [Cercophora newfieldiana]|uniref:Heterokaryon incompatibility protein-domain-containing protein n=1 Tax=Cercophora newfieldiana TaxID=92897 RepID=A0AA39XZB9_9PEZI|nr:heterokaryon incompatibility protein-domain-containing protein [Cercophora newfieldiana]